MKQRITWAVVFIFGLLACEKRQTKPTAIREMKARTPPPEAPKIVDLEPVAPAPEVVPSDQEEPLQKVKEDAIERIRKPAGGEIPSSASTQPKAEELYEHGKTLISKGNIPEGMDQFLASCQLGHIEACHKFAWNEEKSGNPANAFRFYRIACDSGLNKSCNNIGLHLEKQQKWDDALDFYARACLNQHGLGCTNLKRLRTERLQIH